jgi:phosphoribosylglycinamide formyltransferase-1
MTMTRKRVGILISGRGSNMESLINAAQAKDYPAEITLVISNRPDAKGLAIAESKGIPTAVVDHTKFLSRAVFDSALQTKLAENKIEILCLAGFMRVLTDGFVKSWHGRILNVHPSLLPAFKGVDTHKQALRAGVRTHGATVHFVVPELDSGPVIKQEPVPVLPGDNEEKLAARVLAVEHKIYPESLKLLAQGKLAIKGDRVIVGA